MKEDFQESLWTTLLWSIVGIFIIFYPMLVSIYVFLPLMIGFMGYVLVLGIKKVRIAYILTSVIYLVNLEVNLSLPLLLSFVAVLFFYLVIFPQFDILKKCTICSPMLSVIFIDLLYFIFLMGFDIVTDQVSIAIDKLLLYSLVVDMMLVFLL